MGGVKTDFLQQVAKLTLRGFHPNVLAGPGSVPPSVGSSLQRRSTFVPGNPAVTSGTKIEIQSHSSTHTQQKLQSAHKVGNCEQTAIVKRLGMSMPMQRLQMGGGGGHIFKSRMANIRRC